MARVAGGLIIMADSPGLDALGSRPPLPWAPPLGWGTRSVAGPTWAMSEGERMGEPLVRPGVSGRSRADLPDGWTTE